MNDRFFNRAWKSSSGLGDRFVSSGEPIVRLALGETDTGLVHSQADVAAPNSRASPRQFDPAAMVIR